MGAPGHELLVELDGDRVEDRQRQRAPHLSNARIPNTAM
jgi:hypothetical protein